MARPREAVGCRTLICRKADSGQLNDLATIHLVVDKRCAVSGELSGRVGLSQLPAPGPELVAICKGLLPLPI